jgi:hypothetical protein
MTAQIAIVMISSSLCCFVRSTLGSSKEAKWSAMVRFGFSFIVKTLWQYPTYLDSTTTRVPQYKFCCNAPPSIGDRATGVRRRRTPYPAIHF